MFYKSIVVVALLFAVCIIVQQVADTNRLDEEISEASVILRMKDRTGVHSV